MLEQGQCNRHSATCPQLNHGSGEMVAFETWSRVAQIFRPPAPDEQFAFSSLCRFVLITRQVKECRKGETVPPEVIRSNCLSDDLPSDPVF